MPGPCGSWNPSGSIIDRFLIDFNLYFDEFLIPVRWVAPRACFFRGLTRPSARCLLSTPFSKFESVMTRSKYKKSDSWLTFRKHQPMRLTGKQWHDGFTAAFFFILYFYLYLLPRPLDRLRYGWYELFVKACKYNL